jgi:DNA adenine methylase
MKPLLKWAGGKARLAEQIARAFGGSCGGTYFEPFVGSGAVYFHLRSRGLVGRAVLSDANPKLVEVHRAVRDDVEGVLRALDDLPAEDWKLRYYEVRERYNDGPFRGPVHAARFLWLNRAGYNGLYRENSRGAFNVPIGRYSSVSLPGREHFMRVSELLRGAEVRAAQFADVIAQAGEGDHVYCDPPYVPLSATACFTGYTGQGFDHDDQVALAWSARRAAGAGAVVVLSNHDLPVVRDELYPPHHGFRHVAGPRVNRAISRGPRAKVAEVIAAIGPLAKSAA